MSSSVKKKKIQLSFKSLSETKATKKRFHRPHRIQIGPVMVILELLDVSVSLLEHVRIGVEGE